MKVNIGKIETSNWYYNKHNNIKQGEFNVINENLKLTPFVYNSQTPKFFKLVLEWEFRIKDEDKTFNILTLDGTQEFVIELNDNQDKETLKNMLSTSQMHFEDDLKEKLKGTVLESYSFKWVYFDQTADNILALVRKE
ncbi:MAG: hypothetical protein ACOYU6_05510 [Bacteroidota bacterium]|jgi:hypothetical protein|uniref:hypothetical protein n=1 Tax=Hydrotalea lipotrueae TaxID=2803817 RepID=UPI000941F3D9|nr:hypothetical protein [Hydrotalea lipotrueae]